MLETQSELLVAQGYDKAAKESAIKAHDMMLIFHEQIGEQISFYDPDAVSMDKFTIPDI